jgi:integrase
VWADPGLVFTTHIGTALEPRNINRSRLRCANVPMSDRCGLHDLRHSAASFALAAGSDLKLVQTMLRHTRSATTSDIYAHVLEDVSGPVPPVWTACCED